MSAARILIVDDERTARYGMRKTLDPKGEILEADSLKEARRVYSEARPEIVLLDLNLGGENGMDLLTEISNQEDPALVIIITAHGNERVAVEAMKSGAFDYLAKPFNIDELRLIIRNATDRIFLERENNRLRQALDKARGFGEMVGDSVAMERVFALIDKVAETDVTVLIMGESGSGKELVASEIHRRSPRWEAPMVTVNCAAIPENLIESELFGHEKGAFTGALQRRLGKFEQAQGGTLFLDEIGDMPIGTQSKILRVLEQKQVERLGSHRSIEVDVRIISATNQDLKRLVEEGNFREDLFYRLEVVKIGVPPLRERGEDVALLIHHFRKVFAQKHGKPEPEFTPEALDSLIRYTYPGNVRQLRNVIERLVVLCSDSPVKQSDLPEEMRFPGLDGTAGTLTSGVAPFLNLDFKTARETFERGYLLAKLLENRNNITHTAQAIGVRRQSLQQKIRDLDLKKQMSP